MKPPRQPLYLARESYRRRRAMDAARILPVLGIFLFALPRLWGADAGPGEETAGEGLYLFTVWAGLILAAALLGRLLAPSLDPSPGDPPGSQD
ncbi:MAG: hypothetical protein ACXIUV_09835 [Alkalilacustris sp.]